PLVIPVALGLLGSKGNLSLCLDTDDDASMPTHRVLVLNEPEQTFVFEHVTEAPVPALLRGFSAPVRLACDYTSAQLRALMSREDDGFLRWDAAQQYALRVINEVQAQQASGEEGVLDPEYLAACGDLLRDTELDPALVAEMLSLPGENYLADLAAANGGADVDAIHAARKAVRNGIATTHRDALQACYLRLENTRTVRTGCGPDRGASSA
ncbi:MAG TPA: aminopeptidase N, partial [Halieaceae bacterium]|nr:aminopeptidase N [Halieaceae bacterium]